MATIKQIHKEIKVVKPGDIRCHPLNPRRNTKSAKMVAKSIEEYGYINPIVVDEEGLSLPGTLGSRRWNYSVWKNLMCWLLAG